MVMDPSLSTQLSKLELNEATTTSPSLLSLPYDIRILIWEFVLPIDVEHEIPVVSRGTFTAGPAYTPLPRNPRLPLLLLSKQVNRDLRTLRAVTLTVRVYDTSYLEQWLHDSTYWDKKVVTNIHVHSQVVQELKRRIVSRAKPMRDKCTDWIADDLMCYFDIVEIIRSRLFVKGNDTMLDAVFKVQEARDEKIKWKCGRLFYGCW